MLPSVRRVATTAPQSSLLSTLPRATITLPYRPNQSRRYSSSKPSRDNGSPDPSVRQSVQPAAEAKTSEAKASGEKKKRKTKDASDKLKYPSVPTTAHIPSDFLALSSFFSLHRPISVTRGLPRNVSEDAFAAIFAPQTRSQKAAEVMSTLSRTVNDLEQPSPRLATKQQVALDAEAEAEAHNEQIQQKLDLRNADGSPVSLTVQVQNMAGRFLPFRPPPLPQAEADAAKSTAEASAAAAAAEESSNSANAVVEDVHTRVYKAVFTIEETTDGNGEVKIVAHSPELMEDTESSSSSSGAFRRGPRAQGAKITLSLEGAPEPRSFLERMALRQLKFEEAQIRMRRSRLIWWMISVKRQRKLKMKKKKYKKLMRRLRHDRLKQGRT